MFSFSYFKNSDVIFNHVEFLDFAKVSLWTLSNRPGIIYHYHIFKNLANNQLMEKIISRSTPYNKNNIHKLQS